MSVYRLSVNSGIAFTILVALKERVRAECSVIFVVWYTQMDHRTELTEEQWSCCLSCVDLSWSNC